MFLQLATFPEFLLSSLYRILFKGFSQGRTSAMPPTIDQNIVARHGCILYVRCSLLSLISFVNFCMKMDKGFQLQGLGSGTR